MKLQIKFKGFRTDGKGWVEGLLNQYKGKLMICRELIENPTHSEPLGSWIYEENEIYPESLGMFTGKTDKNGKEIFGAIGDKGGDVTKSAIFGRATIVWDEYNCAFVPKWHTKGQTASIHHATKHAEIIGN